MRRLLFLLPLLLLPLAAAACNATPATTQTAANVDKDKLARFVTRFLDVTIGPNTAGTSYILVAEVPETVKGRLPKDADIVGTVVDATSSQTQSLIDIPMSQVDILAHFRTSLKRDGWEERSLDGGAPDPNATSGPFVFCAPDKALMAVAYDPKAPREGFTSTLITTVSGDSVSSPCANVPPPPPPPFLGTPSPSGDQTPGPIASPIATGDTATATPAAIRTTP